MKGNNIVGAYFLPVRYIQKIYLPLIFDFRKHPIKYPYMSNEWASIFPQGMMMLIIST